MNPYMTKQINKLPLWLLILTFVVVVVTSIILYEKFHPWVCQKSLTVTSILELQYRTATVRLDDGTTISVNQATLKPGDKVCTNWKR